MRAARIHDWDKPPVVEDIPVPTRRPGETLVRVDAATVSHLDITVSTGRFELVPPLPYVPGCEGAATVLESDTHAPGTQVIFRDGVIGLDRDGTWREQVAVSDDALMPLGTPLDPAIAATFFVPTTTAYVALFDVGALESGQTVLVSGATGAVGSMALQLAQDAGAEVIALVSRADRLARLPEGVRGVALDDAAATSALRDAKSADLLLDTIGGQSLSERIGWVKPGGKVACLGYTAGTELTIDLPNWFFSDVTIAPVNLLNKEPRAQEVARSLLPKIADGTLRVTVEEFSLDEASTALERLSHGSVTGRAVIRF
ncbi:zinc-binding alcohol dehydrogenase family protein [Gordonia desulfuricans]|uniref:Zinc-binding alcohol dehydrogenase family protein n=1 Tax=Gordonia desulfuricans TaxID=89051 RepID=A0A7K3LSE4_9ACTN|nr:MULTISPECIES: zinc-binding alcohol dehydrogenase family protein [Gordonia]EMP14135.1 NADPH:quinone reductase [Gordonia sp. NB41Y]NDK91159.1 zinc-binding alcohol dehydrogenase family protein [Gordonia desulfuricans]WLP88654.1 zinc-binding alcohol dehydrogenase family protein [Gordonia sp. NB41Y]